MELTFAHPDSGPTEVHIRGCRAATRRTHSHGPVDTRDLSLTVEQLAEMATSPDEGDLLLHRCLGLPRATTKAWAAAKAEAAG